MSAFIYIAIMIQLPVDNYIPNILKSFDQHPNLVLSASPGSGKTTRVPYALLDKFQQILVLEPRRVAALAAAQRICEENKINLGELVGYQVRFEQKISSQTRLKFLTEALLLRKLLQDSNLEGVDLVILDEFHERSQHVDLALGLLREMQLLGHPIKILAMSATLNSQKISDYLGNAPQIEVPGSLFPIEVVYDKKPQLLRTHQEFIERVCSAIKNYSLSTERDTLVFLPGVGEIHKVENEILTWSKSHQKEIQTLYSQMPLSEQKLVLKKSSSSRIILSTNIAESALTIDGVGLVIDSGLERKVEFDEKTESDRLIMQRISKSSATQRAGRSARQFPGQVVRLWTKNDELSFPDQAPAEITRVDLSFPLLALAQQGIKDFTQFTWYEMPPRPSILWAEQELTQIEALHPTEGITSLGQKILKIPTTPRLAKMLVDSEKFQMQKEISEIAALISERDSFPKSSNIDSEECDVIGRWLAWKNSPRSIPERISHQISQVAQQFAAHLPSGGQAKPKTRSELILKIKYIIFKNNLDRLCRRRPSEKSSMKNQNTPEPMRGLKVGGRGVVLDNQSTVKNSDFFIPIKSIELDGKKESIVSWACGASLEQIKEWFPDFVQRKFSIHFDSSRGRMVKTENLYIYDLPLEEDRIADPSPEEVQKFWPEVIFNSWDWIIKNHENLSLWFRRFDYVKNVLKSQNIDFFEFDEAAKKSVSAQLAISCQKLSELEALDLIFFVESQIPDLDLQELKKNWPLTWKAPSGRLCPIQYIEGQNPFVEIKLQECFGMTQHPRLFDGKTQLTFHLLAPNQRPVQVTGDIVSFWKGSYFDVRKELKARYPKHAWPEDPQNVAPELMRSRRS